MISSVFQTVQLKCIYFLSTFFFPGSLNNFFFVCDDRGEWLLNIVKEINLMEAKGRRYFWNIIW